MNAALKPFRGARLNRTHPLARGLVGCWIFNEGTGSMVYDLSGYGNHGTMQNMNPATDWVGGKHGWALDLDGYSSSVFIADNDILDGMSGLTVSVWFNWSGGGGTHKRMVSKWGSSYEYQLYIHSSGGLSFEVDTADGRSGKCSGFYPDPNEWTHAAGTYDGSTVKIYANGELKYSDGSGIGGDIDEGPADVLIGQDTTGNRFQGRISSAFIYRRALSAEEVAWLNREPYCMFEERTRAIFIMPGNPWWYYQRNKMRRSM